MKILLVTSSFRGGGITSYAHEVVNCYSQHHCVSIAIGNDDILPFDRDKYEVIPIESSNLSIENAKKLLGVINELNPDVIINSNSMLMSLVTPYVNNDIKIISVSHSLRYNEADTAGLNSEYIDHIVALSQYNKEYLCRQFNIDRKDKVQVIYNFVNELQNQPKVLADKMNNHVVRIVYAGGTSAAKSPELIYKIMKELHRSDKKFEFIFMGSNSPTLKTVQLYKSLVDIFPHDDRFQFTGRISREEALKLSSTANIFLSPSRREGCPMAMIEAMRVGCILITSDFKNACQEMVEDGVNGFVIPHKNLSGFVDRILDVIDNHSKYAPMYHACYENYQKRFSYEPWRDQMTNIAEAPSVGHLKRLSEFNVAKYNEDKKWLLNRMRFNKYHMLFFETSKSAIPFFFEYIKSKL